ncbi:response regulator NasT [Sporobacter termitidis DSM 10068]|uniref:Response regulator NasT n=1 Tax=Sporobacter termitidis DSM 10068 TaxID=1123282 RepID=A0A1M5VVA2_9FIRM|nr:ANTAR domain-containing protein [Sporobacter termitidis]SHH79176.1 response regulator NasT [Sporobacter termitidis DSM 10068]
MDRIIVAFENENNRKRICEMLEASGITVRLSCRSGSEAIRAARKLSGGIIICGYKLSEMTVTDLAYDLGGLAMVLAIAPPQQLELCRNENVFKLPTPFTKGDLVSSVRMLQQMEAKHFKAAPPRRSEKETAEINKAKEILMNKNGMTEEEAHRFIQRRSMDTGMKAVDTARMIIETYN